MNFHKFLCITIVCFQVVLHTNAQHNKTTYQHAIVLEAGGNGLAYSINYEQSAGAKLHVKLGASLWQMNENQTEKSLLVIACPVSINQLIQVSKQQHFIEAGIGVMNLITTGNLVEYKGITNYYLNPFVNIGYRYRPATGRMDYRAGFSPYYGTKSLTNPTGQGFQPAGSKVQLWGYLGVGYRF